MFKLTVPIAPTTNHCYVYVNNRPIKSKNARAYMANVARQLSKNEFIPFEEKRKIVCEMYFYFPDLRNRDSHNTFKLLFDALQDAGLYPNDRYVLPRVMDFQVDRLNPRLELQFYYAEVDANGKTNEKTEQM